MVVIHMKKSESEQFLFETTTAASVDSVIRSLVAIHNNRIILGVLASAVEELAKYGPSKPEEKRGLDEEIPEAERNENYNKDPMGHRTGNAPVPQLQATLQHVAQDAKDTISKDQVQRKVALSEDLLQEKLDNIRGAVTMAFPMGLPEHDPIHIILNDSSALVGTQAGQGLLDPNTAQLWWAGKEFLRDQTLADRVGRNEKTKIVAKLQKRGQGAPVREPAVSEEERRAMLAFYHKKKEEAKQLAENDDDEYLQASWADSSALKSSLLGVGDVRWKPGRR